MRSVFDNTQSSFDLMRLVDPHSCINELWIKGGPSEFLRRVEVEAVLKKDKAYMGEQATYLCDALLIVRAIDLPRRPAPTELLFCPRNTSWEIMDVYESEGLYHIALNRSRAPSQ